MSSPPCYLAPRRMLASGCRSAGDLFAAKQRDWWGSLELTLTERLRVDQDLSTLDHLAKQIATVEAELHRLSTTARWANQVPYLVQRAGIGLISAMILLSAIGDVTPVYSRTSASLGTG